MLLRSVEKDKLPIALKGASDKMKDLFLKNMSERAGEDAARRHGGARSGQVARCGRGAGRHCALAKELAAQGAIEIAESKDEEMVY